MQCAYGVCREMQCKRGRNASQDDASRPHAGQMQSKAESVEGAMPSPLAGHAVNPSVEARWRHPCRHTVPQPARAPHQTIGRRLVEKLSALWRASDMEPMLHDRTRRIQHCSAMHTDHLDWPLPAHRRGTLSGMDAAPEPTRTYLRRVLRWWAGKGPAARLQITPCSQVADHTLQRRRRSSALQLALTLAVACTAQPTC
ncbi:hypothetical protein CPBF424_06850 [Xanthomonas euroxanthea]|uniref:Uncharacterized protein n=1 Tax=Xanthomonas euroxanthea TaxID=2259622 RepID=A0AA46H972_9XANT|nr:hypothetical protein CPBF424_06850 [Xanthomonas euroxanthea]